MANLIIRALQTQEIDLAGEIFPEGDALLSKPGFKTSMCRVGLLDGHIAGGVLVERRMLRYGRSSLRVAGLGALRGDGIPEDFAHAMMQDALAYIMEQGAHLALLHSSLDFNGRFGFSPVWPYYLMEFPAAQAAALQPEAQLRRAHVQDVPRLADLYERHWGGRVTFPRSPEMWMWRAAHPGPIQIMVAESAPGRVDGYLAGEDMLNAQLEVVADTRAAAWALMAEAGRQHQRAGSEMVSWLIPPDDALVAFARQAVDVTLSARFPRSGGWVARLIDAPGLVEALLPEITTQAETVLPGFDAAALHMTCQPSNVHIRLRGRDGAACELSHADFIQVMFGSLSPAALGVSGALDAAGVRLLQALFPARIAALGCWDWF